MIVAMVNAENLGSVHFAATESFSLPIQQSLQRREFVRVRISSHTTSHRIRQSLIVIIASLGQRPFGERPSTFDRQRLVE
jgi:hypothetical protein